MMTPAESSRILVATDNLDDAALIVRQLEGEFDSVRSSTDPARSAQDFEACAPDVLVLAFDSLEKSQRYYLGLYKTGPALPQDGHRTVILCHRDELKAVVDLCKKEYFDDYVMFWPHSHDADRLAMSIRIACREMAAIRSNLSRRGKLLSQAKHVDALDRILVRGFADAERHAADTRHSLACAEREISEAIDDFSSRLTDKDAASWVHVKDAGVLAREVGQLKAKQIAAGRRVSAIEVESGDNRARALKKQLEPVLAGTRALAEEARKIRPLVMVVEDDEFARQLVSRTLDPASWEAVYANDGAEALGYLRKMRPDVILMDVRLPGLDGVSLTTRLKASPQLATIPVIIMTGHARKETLESSIAAGAVAFVVKPFTRELLTAKLERALALPQEPLD